MKWQGRRQSDNLEDRRGMSTTGKVAIGGGAIGILFMLVQLFMGGDSADILNTLSQQMQQPQQTQEARELTPRKVGRRICFYCFSLHGRHMGSNIPTKWQNIYRTQDGALYRCDNIRMRWSQCQHRSLLLSGRSDALYGHSLPQCVERPLRG